MQYQQLALWIVVAFGTTSIAEEPRATLGVLTCTSTKSAESGAKMLCGFKATASAAEERYEGTANGLDDRTVGREVLVWTVIGPASTKPPSGFLAQPYRRAKVAGRPPSWIGVENSAIVLQFESHASAETGGAIKELELKVARTTARNGSAGGGGKGMSGPRRCREFGAWAAGCVPV